MVKSSKPSSNIGISGWILLLGIVVAAALIGPWFSPYDFKAATGPQFSAPSALHWLGTDVHGRDVLTRILYGARISLMVGCIGALISLTVGVSYGLVSGYAGGWIDNLMMRFVEILYSLPRLILVIILIALFDERVKIWMQSHGLAFMVSDSRLIMLFVGLGLVEWLTMARIIRGQVLSLRELQFVQASRSLGQNALQILVRHLLPNLMPVILVYLTLTIPSVILDEAFLSFLGLGVEAPNASWGTLLADGASMINPIRMNWWLLLGPALFMAATLMALNFLGDTLRDKYDPKSRK